MLNGNLFCDLRKNGTVIPLEKHDYTLPDERLMNNMMKSWYEYFDIQVGTANIFNSVESTFCSIDRMMRYLMFRGKEFPKDFPER